MGNYGYEEPNKTKEKPDKSIWICPKCQAKNMKISRYCSNCGNYKL